MESAFKNEHPHYEGLYKRSLDKRKDEVRGVMELGVAEGKSLLTWLDWFPHAQVVGVDNRPARGVSPARCRILQADQCDPSLAQLGNFDLIIDDAGHDPIKQRRSLELLWPCVNPGGFYVVEDVETSYWGIASWNEDKLGGCRREGYEHAYGVIVFLKELMDGLTAAYANQRPERFKQLSGLMAIHWHPNIVFLEKRS